MSGIHVVGASASLALRVNAVIPLRPRTGWEPSSPSRSGSACRGQRLLDHVLLAESCLPRKEAFCCLLFNGNILPSKVKRGLDIFRGIIYHRVMAGRPTKEPGEKMDVPLRIMLTASQSELIRSAAGGDVSAWARPILLEAARQQVKKRKKSNRLPEGSH